MAHPKLRVFYAGTGGVMVTACTAAIGLRFGNGTWGVEYAMVLDWIIFGCLAGAVGMAIIYFATSDQPSREVSQVATKEGNYAGRDNLGTQFRADKIEYYAVPMSETSHPISPPEKRRPEVPELPNLTLDFVCIRAKINADEELFRHDEEGSECIFVMVRNMPGGHGESTFDATSVFATLTFEHGSSRSVVNRACWLNEPVNQTRIDVGEMKHVLIGFPVPQESKWVSVNNPNKEQVFSDWSHVPLLELETREMPWVDGLPVIVDIRVISTDLHMKNVTLAHRRMRLVRNGPTYHGDWT